MEEWYNQEHSITLTNRECVEVAVQLKRAAKDMEKDIAVYESLCKRVGKGSERSGLKKHLDTIEGIIKKIEGHF